MMVLIAALSILLAIGVHYWALLGLNRYLPKWEMGAHIKLFFLIVIIFLLHLTEIMIFATVIFASANYFPQLGSIAGLTRVGFHDALYLSATTYTTVGYGDLVPLGGLRLYLGLEGLAGLLLIAWSASFTYLEMSRYWQKNADE